MKVRKKKTEIRAVKYTGSNMSEMDEALELVYSGYLSQSDYGDEIQYYDKNDRLTDKAIGVGQWLVTSNKGENGTVKVLFENEFREKYEEA